MITNGFIVIDRRIINWRWFDNPIRVQAWIWMLCQANWTDVKWHNTIIKRGSFATSYRKIGDALGCCEKTARNIVNDFIQGGEILKTNTRRYTIITICNYDIYQNQNEKEYAQSTAVDTAQSTAVDTAVDTAQSTAVDTARSTAVDTDEKTHGLPTIEQYNNITNNTSSSSNGDGKIKLTYIKTKEVAFYFAKQDEEWRNSAMMRLRIGNDLSKLNGLIIDFQNELKASGVEEKEEKDLRKHFMSFARKVLSSEKKRDRGQETGQKQGKKMADPSAYGIDQKVFTDKWEE